MKFVSFDKLNKAVELLKELITKKVSKSGDTMTGNLKVGLSSIGTNGYIEGTWFKATANLASSTKSNLWCVLKDGWIYTRTTAQVKQDLNIPDKSLDATVEESVLIFYKGATVSNNVLIVG